MTESNQREININGHIEVSDELCEDGSEALVFITEDGEELVIRNRKVVKRLKKYAYQEDMPIKIHGLVKRSTDGINVLGVLGYEAPKPERESEPSLIISDMEPRRKRSSRRRKDDLFVSLDEDSDLLDSELLQDEEDA